MRTVGKAIASAAAVAGLLTSSVAAAMPTAPAAAPASSQIDPWAVLSVMSGSVPAATLCGAATAATSAQGGGCVFPQLGVVPPPPPPPAALPPPPPPLAAAGFGGIPIPVLGILLATLLADILIATHHNNRPNSPA